MSTLSLVLPYRLLSRHAVPLLFLVGLPLATWLVWVLAPLLAAYVGYDPVHAPLALPLGP